MKSRFVLFVLLIFLIPMVSSPSGSSLSITENASAADACKGDLEPVRWNETVQRVAMVPHFSPYDDWWGYFEEDDRRGKGKNGDSDESNQQENEIDMSLSPEPEWMYDSPWNWENRLEPLVTNHHSTLLVGNDSVGAIKVNLSANQRTTVCITLQDLAQDSNSNINADIYLLTSSEFSKYEESYYSSHSNGWYSDAEESLSDIPPEWRSFNIAGWQTFRDSHQYEDIKEVSFSVSLDGPEISSSLFGGDSNQYFNIVIDNTNNSHSGDALPETTIAAYVSVVSEERSTILPNWTVSLVCCGLMMATMVIPIVMNKRYMEAGLSLTSENQQLDKGLVPSLEQTDND